jgi:hypothetical protein
MSCGRQPGVRQGGEDFVNRHIDAKMIPHFGLDRESARDPAHDSDEAERD